MEFEKQQMYDAFAIVVLGIFITVTILVVYKNFFIPFNAKTRYIKMEIKRSDGKEYDYWKKQLKLHYIRSIPIVGKSLSKLCTKNSSHK